MQLGWGDTLQGGSHALALLKEQMESCGESWSNQTIPHVSAQEGLPGTASAWQQHATGMGLDIAKVFSCISLPHMQGVDDLPGKGKKHVGLSLRVRRLHSSLTAASLEEGMGLTACVSSVEDHGYILNFGIKV